MNQEWAQLFLGLVESAPVLIGDARELFDAIANSGVSGQAKVESLANILLRLAHDAALAVSARHASISANAQS